MLCPLISVQNEQNNFLWLRHFLKFDPFFEEKCFSLFDCMSGPLRITLLSMVLVHSASHVINEWPFVNFQWTMRFARWLFFSKMLGSSWSVNVVFQSETLCVFTPDVRDGALGGFLMVFLVDRRSVVSSSFWLRTVTCKSPSGPLICEILRRWCCPQIINCPSYPLVSQFLTSVMWNKALVFLSNDYFPGRSKYWQLSFSQTCNSLNLSSIRDHYSLLREFVAASSWGKVRNLPAGEWRSTYMQENWCWLFSCVVPRAGRSKFIPIKKEELQG